MNYGQLKTEWQNRLGVTDGANTALPGLINEGLRMIASRSNFDFYKQDATIPVLAPLTTGTVAVTNGSDQATFSVALTSAQLDQVIRVGSDSAWYTIAEIDGTLATLSGPYTGDTDAAASYSVWHWQVDLPADYSLASLKQIVLQDPSRELRVVFEDDWTRRQPDLIRQTGYPEVLFEFGEAKLRMHPLPDLSGNLFATYYRQPELFVYDTDASAIDLPYQYHDVLLHYCLFNQANGIRESLAQAWQGQFEQGMQVMTRRHGLRPSMRVKGRRWSPRSYARSTLNGELS